MMNMRLLTACAMAALLIGCAAPVSKIDSGQALVKQRLLVDVALPWNQFERGESANVPTWTHEGITVDALRFYVGLKDGELLAPTPSEPKGQRDLAFRAAMQPAEIADLFQSLWARDGSAVTLERIEPAPFLAGDGFRFDYSIVRKIDDVRLQGVAWAAVRNRELFVINYSAPRLAFFPRHRAQVEAIAQSARIKG